MTKLLQDEVNERLESIRNTRDQEIKDYGNSEWSDLSDAELLETVLTDIADCGSDFHGNFQLGIIPTFVGTPAVVAEAIRKQQEFLADHERQHNEWKKIWREAKKELKAVTK